MRKANTMIDPVTEDNMPVEWGPEKCVIAKDAMKTLQKHYPKWLWGIEFNDDPATGGLDSMVIRILDVPTETAYYIRAQDIDRDRMHCVLIGGGMLLEALGLSRTRNRQDEVHGLRRTPAGLIVPDPNAVIETNPGYSKIKTQAALLR
jgi:hypothetical protein